MKTKYKTSTKKNSENDIKSLLKNNNFRNNQNYIISKKFYFNKYMPNIDNLEKLYSRIITYFIILSLILSFYGVNEVIINYKENIHNFNPTFGLIIIYLSLLFMILTYVLFFFKYKFFVTHRVKNYRVISTNNLNKNIIIFNK